jgi:hypothetical protein
MNNDRYDNDYPSVTGVLGVLRKIGLEIWFKYNTAKFCDGKSERGKLNGKLIHQAIHDYIETGSAKISTQNADEVKTALQSFILFRKENPEYILKNSETKMTSQKYKCNGTLDCLAEVNGRTILADWKTGECKKKEKPDIYDEYIYQCAAYVYFYNEVFNDNIDEAVIISLAKDKIAYSKFTITKEMIIQSFKNAFLPALSIYHQNKITKGWIKEA